MKTVFMKWGAGVFLALVLISNSIFVVAQTNQVLVLQFGEIVRVVQKPGLNFKVPFMQSVIFFDKRLLDFRTQAGEFITRNKTTDVEERVVIDAFVRYRITDPVQFYQSVKTEQNLASRLNSVVLSNMRKTIANYSLADLLSENRNKIMEQIRAQVNRQANVARVENSAVGASGQGFGIEVLDLRIVRADLPLDITSATYERMIQNFTKEAIRFRAEGDQKALEITSNADRERTEIIANAKKEAETIRGAGDGTAAEIYGASYSKDPEFFRFYRAMQAYRNVLKPADTTIIMSPDSEFLREMN
jgi:modulator of FtsH protease HflC